MLITLENESTALMGKWISLKVLGKKDTRVKARKLYIDSDVNKHEQIINYYNNLIENGVNPKIALLKSILCEKNVTGIVNNDNELKLLFESESIFFNKKPAIGIALYSPDIKEYKEELIDVSYKNYSDSRYQFLYKNIEKDNNEYKFNTKSGISSYDKNEKSCTFNLVDYNSSKFYLKEQEFLIFSIEEILNKYNEMCYLDYGVITSPNNNVNYYVKDLVLEVLDIKIKIDLLDDTEFDNIMDKVYEHNKRVEKLIKKEKR